MSAQRILVTGASGFVGKLLMQRLDQEFPSSQITGIAREERLINAKFNYISANLAQDDLLPLLNTLKPDLIFHLAAHSSVGQAEGQGAITFEENVQSCFNLAHAIRRLSSETRLVFASSGEVYGHSFNLKTPISEDVPADPQNAYARSKLVGEFIFKEMLSGVCPVTILRLFNHFGAGQDERFVIPSFIAQLKSIQKGLQKPVLKVGNLEAVRDFLPVSDVLEAYLKIANMNVKEYSLYNVCSGQGRSIHSIVEDLIEIIGLKITFLQEPSRMRASDIPLAIGNNQKFKDATGWAPQADWLVAIRKMFLI